MKLNDAIMGALMLALALLILFHIQGFPNIPGQNIGPAAFPGLLAILLGGCSLALIWRGWHARHGSAWIEFGSWLASPPHVVNFLVTVGVLVFYLVTADTLGFMITGVLLLSALFLSLRVRPVLILPIALVATLAVHTIFYKMLRVPLPWGLLQPVAW